MVRAAVVADCGCGRRMLPEQYILHRLLLRSHTATFTVILDDYEAVYSLLYCAGLDVNVIEEDDRIVVKLYHEDELGLAIQLLDYNWPATRTV